MKRKTRRDHCVDTLESSPLVRRFAKRIADAAADAPILDVACGSGRNAMLLSQLGCIVICVDKDLSPIQSQLLRWCRSSLSEASARLTLHHMDLVKDTWPFGAGVVGGIINVHFLLPSLFPSFESSLLPGGYLLLETVPGCGGNYLELPKAGAIRSAFGKTFDFEFYREGKTGPSGYDAVTVQMLAKRKK